MKKTRVGVVRGGPGAEYEESIKTGSAIIAALDRDKYDVIDVFVDREGRWHIDGMPIMQKELADRLDVAVVALHGEYGSGGWVQGVLEQVGVPYTGSGVVSSATAFDRGNAKEQFTAHGIHTPFHATVANTTDLEHELLEIFRSHPAPFFVKPNRSRGKEGLGMANTYHELVDAVQNAMQFGDAAIIEEFIDGAPATCAVIEEYRDEDVYTMPVVETNTGLFGGFDAQENDAVRNHARRVHDALNLRHYAQIDFIVSPRGIFALAVNPHPEMHEDSLHQKSLEAIGFDFPEFLDHIIGLALRKHAF